MKKNLIQLVLVSMFISMSSFAQFVPDWTQTINSSPDSANVAPVKVMNDHQGNVITLSNYLKTGGVGTIYKVYLNKYTMNGVLIWNQVFDNNGTQDFRSTDMVIDDQDNIYIAGGLMSSMNYEPYLIKVLSSGFSPWQRTGTMAFTNGMFSQVEFRNSKLYLRADMGLAVFNLSGTELWSNSQMTQAMKLDYSGHIIVSAYSSPQTLFVYDSTGVIIWSDSTIIADRIAVDGFNNIYLLGQYSYELAKFDSNGVFQWSYNNFPLPPPFGDLSFDVVVDYNQDVYVTGLNDTMYKFDPNGQVLWSSPMEGLDQYLNVAKVNYNNMLTIAGIRNGINGYDILVNSFNSNGIVNWSGYYSSNNVQEFTVSMSLDPDGIYVLEDSISNSTVMKFEQPWQSAVLDFSTFCVDSVWYDSSNPALINISVFNGGVSQSNYPSIQMIAPNGDTISNVNNLVNFFAQIPNTHQVYTDSITVSGITDFSQYHFIYYDGFGTSFGEINFCPPVSVSENELSQVELFPNPAVNAVMISNLKSNESYTMEIVDVNGKKVFEKNLEGNSRYSIDLNSQSAGLYFVRLINKQAVRVLKLNLSK